MQCKTENTGQFGQQSLVECVIKTTQEVSNPQIRVVAWRKEGVKDPLLVFNKGEFEQKEGYKLAEPSWDKKNMNVSLLITNTAVEHEGEYVCMVITNSGDSTGKTNLKVTGETWLRSETCLQFGTDDHPETYVKKPVFDFKAVSKIVSGNISVF